MSTARRPDRRRAGITLVEMLVAMGVFAVISCIAIELYLRTRQVTRQEATRAEMVASHLELIALIRRDVIPASRVLHRLGPFRSDLRTLILDVPASDQPDALAPSRHRYVVYHPAQAGSHTIVRAVYASPAGGTPLEEVVAEGAGDVRFAYDTPAPSDARLVGISMSARREVPPRRFAMTYQTTLCLRNAGGMWR
jgi:prepilin-type N-terminal cleavage/methylation domain-containing protein